MTAWKTCAEPSMSDERNAGESTSEQRSLTTLGANGVEAYGLARALKSALQPTIFLVQLPV